MGRPIPPPQLVFDEDGHLRRKLKRGRGGPKDPDGPHAQYFSADGARVDKAGRPVEARSRDAFQPIQWDLAERDTVPPDPPAIEPTAALGLARRSRTFQALLTETLHRGWLLDAIGAWPSPGVRRGPDIAGIETTPRSAFVARVIFAVAHAHALQEPMPVADVKAAGFARENAVFLMRRWGTAMLDLATVRDEVLAAGGADIGGPGLRGLQLEAYDIHCKRADVARARVVDALAFSIDGAVGATFDPAEGPLVHGNLVRGFVPGGLALGKSRIGVVKACDPAAGSAPAAAAPRTFDPGGDLESDEAIAAIGRLAELPALDAAGLLRALPGIALKPCPRLIESPYLASTAAEPSEGPWSRIELVAPKFGVHHLRPRVLLWPRPRVGLRALEVSFGRGLPHHADVLDGGLVTQVFATETCEVFSTYDASDWVARVITVRRR